MTKAKLQTVLNAAIKEHGPEAVTEALHAALGEFLGSGAEMPRLEDLTCGLWIILCPDDAAEAGIKIMTNQPIAA